MNRLNFATKGRKTSLAIAILFSTMSASLSSSATPDQNSATQRELYLGDRLADYLRAGRTVISSNQSLINDPTIGDKGLTADLVISNAQAGFIKARSLASFSEGLEDEEIEVFDAMTKAIWEIVDESQDDINKEGVDFKGFIPAVFARLVNKRFSEIMDDKVQIKVTAPIELVRNRTSVPDDWELKAIETYLLAEDWPQGDTYYETLENGSLRMIIPEYYNQSCLACHGQPVGQLDLTGYPMEGGVLGQLGGAISISFNK